MPYYRDLDPQNKPEDRRTIERLLALRKQLDTEVPARRALEQNLLLATWNIREFDSPAYGERLPEALYYMAEIIARFDLIAIQEVRKDLRALEQLVYLLGQDYWRYIVTDVTEGSSGNNERMAFVYDWRKVMFGGLAGELVLPPIKRKDEHGKTIYEPVTQLARTPFMCGFRANWAKFMLCTVHILYGAGTATPKERVEEIRQIAQFLRRRTLDQNEWSQNLILLGDFNIFKPTDETMQVMLDAGFKVPDGIQQIPTNAKQNKFYDQMAFRAREDRFGEVVSSGVFDYYKTVFRPEDEAIYVPAMGDAYEMTSSGKPRKDKSAYYTDYWRTFQMSDHLPMWVEILIDYSDEFLQRKLDSGG
jgi:endonuclease/exonuclease/phosphatase family metal-dependent hydrolase